MGASSPDGQRGAWAGPWPGWALALLTISLALTACRPTMPWTRDQLVPEVNLSFILEKNLIYLNSAQINGARGKYYFASANARTVFDPTLTEQLRSRRYRLQLNDRESIPVIPLVLDLGGLGDALIGADVWGPYAVTIDYASGLLSYQKEGIHPSYMTLFAFEQEPMILVEVNGQQIAAVVDTSSPDTLVLPRSSAGERTRATVVIAGTDFGEIDIALGETTRARVGNRLLSKFLVTIDYGRGQVGLWRDPRIPLDL